MQLGLITAKVEERLFRNVLRIQKKYNDYSIKNRLLEPHITLVPPGKLEVESEEAIEEFKHLMIDLEAFNVHTKGIDFFENKDNYVIYIRVGKSSELIKLRQVLQDRIQGKIIRQSLRYPGKFIPHITVAYVSKKLDIKEVLGQIQQELEGEVIYLQRLINLYIKTNPESSWELIAQKSIQTV